MHKKVDAASLLNEVKKLTDSIQVLIGELRQKAHLESGHADHLQTLAYAAIAMKEKLQSELFCQRFTDIMEKSLTLEAVCTNTIEWILKINGPCNIAIMCTPEIEGLNIAACLKGVDGFNEAQSEIITQKIDPLLSEYKTVCINNWSEIANLSSDEQEVFENQTLAAVHYRYLGQTIARIIMYRPAEKPFDEQLINALRLMENIFVTKAVSLQTDDDTEDEDTWWKNGEPPPF